MNMEMADNEYHEKMLRMSEQRAEQRGLESRTPTKEELAEMLVEFPTWGHAAVAYKARCVRAEEALRELAGYVRAHLAGNDADPELRYALEQADDALAVVPPEPQDDDFSDDPQAHLQGRGAR